jgi:hypothetical protein
MQAGGESYKMIPCLNTNPLWVKTIAGWIENFNKKSIVSESIEKETIPDDLLTNDQMTLITNTN